LHPALVVVVVVAAPAAHEQVRFAAYPFGHASSMAVAAQVLLL
jgi:hypothetical protein